MSRTRYKVIESNVPHFVTCTTILWLPVFSSPEATEILIESLKFLEEEGALRLFGYVILENHIHMIVEAQELGRDIGRFKSFTARRIIDRMQERGMHDWLDLLSHLKARHKKDRKFQLWQESFHPQVIQGQEMMRQKLEYMHANPVRKGFVDDPVHWRWSSSRDYAGKPGTLKVITSW